MVSSKTNTGYTIKNVIKVVFTTLTFFLVDNIVSFVTFLWAEKRNYTHAILSPKLHSFRDTVQTREIGYKIHFARYSPGTRLSQ